MSNTNNKEEERKEDWEEKMIQDLLYLFFDRSEHWENSVGEKVREHLKLYKKQLIHQELQKAREEQGKRFVTLMNQALGETELPEDVWKKIAKVNQLILDK